MFALFDKNVACGVGYGGGGGVALGNTLMVDVGWNRHTEQAEPKASESLV